MGKFVSKIAKATVAAAAVACALEPAHAMPIPTVREIAVAGAQSNVQEVDWHGGGHGGWVGGCGAFGCGATHGGWGGGGWRGGWGGGYHGGWGGGYYGGGNDWYPLAAFGTGALIGALAAQPYYYSDPYYYPQTYYYPRAYYYPRTYYHHRTYYHQSGHYAWCAGRYHPYRCYVTHY
jgi:hypothetical protein